MKRIYKYGTLIIVGLLTIFTILPFGDSCSGLAHIFGAIFLMSIFIIFFLIVTGIDLYKYFKKKIRFDYIPLLIVGVLSLMIYLSFESDSNYFFKKIVLEGKIVSTDDLRMSNIILFDNNDFIVETHFIEWTCRYRGKYILKKDTLVLGKEGIKDLTNNIFTTKYKVNDSLLVPVVEGFPNIRVSLKKK